jgi:hypothetical protein
VKPPTKTEARRLARAVKAALKRKECQHWRDGFFPKSEAWNDGPCYATALAIRCVDGGRGEMMEVSAGAHAVYVLAGVAIDGHGVYDLQRGRLGRPERPHPLGWHHGRKKAKGWSINWRRTHGLVFLRAPATLVRAIRRELRRMK